MSALEERHLLADRALGYVELYGAYAETEALYRVDRLLDLWERLDEEDRRLFCLDPGAVDWEHYVREVHLPSVIEHARVRTSPTRARQTDRPARARAAILSPDRHLAAFDLENTLIASNVVDSYAWLAPRHLRAGRRPGFVADLVREAPSLLALDRRDRGDFLRYVLPAIRRSARRAPAGRRVGAVHRPAPRQVVPGRSGPGPSAPGPRTPHPADHRRSRPGRRASAPAVRRHHLRPPGRGRRRVHRSARRAPPDRRGPGPRPRRLRGRRRPRARGVHGLRGFGERPADARGRRLSGCGQPRGQARGRSPGAGAGTSSTGRRKGAAPDRRSRSDRSTPRSAAGRLVTRRCIRRVSAPPHTRSPRLKSLVFERNLPRYAASRRSRCSAPAAARGSGPSDFSTSIRRRDPVPTGNSSGRCSSGICGSDLATVDGRSLAVLRADRQLPLRPRPRGRRRGRRRCSRPRRPPSRSGHPGGRRTGARVRPAGHRAPLSPVRGGAHRALRERRVRRVAPGLQTGYCADTGGGWSIAG